MDSKSPILTHSLPILTCHQRQRTANRAVVRRALFVLSSLALSGLHACSADDPTVPESKPASEAAPSIELSVVHDFAIDVEAATRDGKIERLSNGIAQYAGAIATFHYMLPKGARLTGHATARGGVARLQIDLLTDRGDERPLVEYELAPNSSGFTLNADLSEYAGEMLAFRFALEPAPDNANEGARVEWTRLGIESPTTPLGNVFAGERGRYNVIVIVFDSLRPDFTEPYGDDSIKTSNLAKLAEQGVVFLNARSSANWTRASIAAMFTSLEPEATGVLAIGDMMPETGSYLPEVLRENGYRTLALTNNGMLSNAFGFQRGFDRVVELFLKNPKAVHHESAEFRARYAWRNWSSERGARCWSL